MVAAVGIAALLGVAGWPQPGRIPEFSGLILIAMLLAALVPHHSVSEGRATMTPSFVISFTSLLLFGTDAAMLVALSATVAAMLAHPPGSHSPRQVVSSVATAAIGIPVAGLAYRTLGGAVGHFIWPWAGMPIAVAAVAYCVVKTVSAEVLVPLSRKQSINRAWPTSALWHCPPYLVAAGIAAGLAEAIEHGLWQVLPVAAVPMYFAGRVYCDYVLRLEDERRRREVIGSLHEGMCVVDATGRVTLWNEALERMLDCPRERAMGRPLADAAPALAGTTLPRLMHEVSRDRTARTIAHLGLASASATRILSVEIVPVAEGMTLLWRDVTDRTRTELALKRNEERLTLAAEGANDGLWEWDLRREEFYVSGRWKTMLGLPASATIGRTEDWFERVHPEDRAALKEALKAHLFGDAELLQHEHRLRHEDGTYRRFLCRAVAVRAAGGRSNRVAGSLTDTTEHAVAQERLRSAGFVDALTGLCNRSVFVEGVGRRLEEFKRRRGGPRFAVLYLDLDRFKIVNDSLGHLVGDELLIAVSRRLESCLRPGDVLARLGGDEFSILLNGLETEEQANAIAFRLQATLGAPFSIGGREVFSSASIGIAFGVAQYATPDEIMRDADTAMYHAKARGKARHELFDADMHARARDRLGLESDLRNAVHSNQFEVYYQPIVSLASGMCIGFESLVRWTRNGQSVSPATFIPIAEELGLIEPLGTSVMQQACRTFADWQRRFPGQGLDCITVNVSSRQLMQQNFLNIVEQAVQTAGLKPAHLRLEITETALMDTPHIAAEVLRELRDFGVKIYLDDFGTGYSSLSHLHKLPVDALKIDRSFVNSLVSPDRPAIVESILALARTLNTSVVAEGIEFETQARELQRLGCTHAQGFLFSRPLSTENAERLLIANQPLGPKQASTLAGSSEDPGLFYPSGSSFEWPKEIPVRPEARAQSPAAVVEQT